MSNRQGSRPSGYGHDTLEGAPPAARRLGAATAAVEGVDWAEDPVRFVQELGQSVWLDELRREFLRGGQLSRLIKAEGISGTTSDPVRFKEAIVADAGYRDEILSLHVSGALATEIPLLLAMQDAREAATELFRVYERSGRRDGFVSIDISPRLASSAAATISEARRVWTALDRPNVMIKVPATPAGCEAARQLIADGINVNASLLYGVSHYRQVLEAFASGLEERVRTGRPIAGVASVAGVPVSEIDWWVDAKLALITDPDEALRARALLGKAGVEVARFAYQEFKQFIASPRWQALAAYEAQPQRLLWVSTRSDNPAYSDVKYVDALIGRDTVTAVSLETLSKYKDHGRPAPTLERNPYETAVFPSQLTRCGLPLEQVGEQLQAEGLRAHTAGFERSVAEISELFRKLRSTSRGN